MKGKMISRFHAGQLVRFTFGATRRMCKEDPRAGALRQQHLGRIVKLTPSCRSGTAKIRPLVAEGSERAATLTRKLCYIDKVAA